LGDPSGERREMSDEFFMFTHAREGVTVSGPYEDGADGREVRLRDVYRSPDNPKGLVSVRQPEVQGVAHACVRPGVDLGLFAGIIASAGPARRS
jgi:hypothetical protein